MDIKKFTFDQMVNLLYDNNSSNHGWVLPITKEYCFENFYYFAPSNFNQLSEHEENFIVAFDNNTIVGVLCYGMYGYTTKYQAVSFIDVHQKYKNKGIATALIKELNNHIDKSQSLTVSALSREGEMCHLDKIFKKFLDVEIILNKQGD